MSTKIAPGNNNNNNNNKNNNNNSRNLPILKQARSTANVTILSTSNIKSNIRPPVSVSINANKRVTLRKNTNIKMLAASTVRNMATNFDINHALDYTCHRIYGNDRSYDYCGKCNSCQILNNLNNLKQWFDRASHVTIKKLLIGLVVRINNQKIYKHLSDLLRPLTQSKDFVYARNKFVPSCDQDHLKPTNNRCLDDKYVDKQIDQVWQWFSSSNEYIKLNFMLSLLNKSEQAVVFLVILKINSILDENNDDRLQRSPTGRKTNLTNFHFNDSEIQNMTIQTSRTKSKLNYDDEIVLEAFDDEEDDFRDDSELQNLFYNEFYENGKEAKYVDFIRQLPVHLSKSILKSLTKKSLYNCALVCKYWYNIVKEVNKEDHLHRILLDDMMLLKGTSSKGSNPKYANNIDVKVPNLYPGTNDLILNPNEKEINATLKSECNWTSAYSGYSTRNVIMEERNVFCGAYNVLLLKEKRDPHRIIHFNGKNIIAYGSFDKRVRFIDMKSASERPNAIQGHSGSIKCIYICESKRIVITGSYDTTIRCWSLDTGKCLRIYQGHQQTVSCISMHDEHETIITGSSDKTCKVWLLDKKKAWRTFKHNYPIVSVAIGEELCVSGGRNGKIKVFHLLNGSLIKTISAHNGPVNALKFDRWHILTCSSDGYALLFSAQGKHKKCIMAMRHPKEVLCLEYQFLRVITGSADGKIRIWNILNGDCIRVMRGNSLCDPVLSITIVENRILINTENNVIMMEFEKIKYEYDADENEDLTNISKNNKKSNKQLIKKSKNYSSIRASRMELVGTPNPKLFDDGRKSVLDHSARPISAKNLKDAKLVHQLTSKQSNLPRNSVGDVSDSALQKHQNLINNINQTIQSRTSLSVLSYTRDKNDINNEATSTSTKANISNYKTSIKDDNNLNDQNESNKKSSESLNATKTFLREQLKELKQLKQMSKEEKEKIKSLNENENKTEDAKSCVESRVINKIAITKKCVIEVNNMIRPTSSPSKIDTKTKIKRNQTTASVIAFYNSNKKIISNNSDLESNDGDNDDKASDSTFDRKPEVNHIQPVMQLPNKIVSKMFETQEANLKTNSNMHPIDIKSKLPNPKMINLIRPQTVQSFKTKTQINSLINSTNSIKVTNDKPKLERSKSAFFMDSNSNINNSSSILMTTDRSKTPLTNRSNRKYDISQNDSKLSSHDNLNLMTFKEIDLIVEKINGSLNNNQEKKNEKNDDLTKKIYKKMWLLKSNGLFHGSLLSRPKAIAPEIRE